MMIKASLILKASRIVSMHFRAHSTDVLFCFSFAIFRNFSVIIFFLSEVYFAKDDIISSPWMATNSNIFNWTSAASTEITSSTFFNRFYYSKTYALIAYNTPNIVTYHYHIVVGFKVYTHFGSD